MLTFAGCAVATENARDEIKEVADEGKAYRPLFEWQRGERNTQCKRGIA